MDLKEEHILGKQALTHWYYKAKAKALLKFLNGIQFDRVLDVGAGSGFFSSFLLKNTHAVQATCVDTGYSEVRRMTICGKSLICIRSCDDIDADLVLMMDVLEHVEDDIELVKEYSSKVPRGAYFLITVPAFSFLWSSHDVYLGHKRRYTIKQVERLMSASGLACERSSYFFGLILPIAATRRILSRWLHLGKATGKSDLQQHSSPVNMLLLSICALELPLLGLNRVAGLTIFCLGRKP